MPDQPVVGHQMNFYYNSAVPATPTWVLIDEIADLSIPDLELGMAELKRRANDFTKNLGTLFQSFGVEFRLHTGLNKTVFDVLRAAFFARTIMEFAIMDGPIATSNQEGIRMPGIITQFPWDQPLEDVAGHDVRLAIAYFESPAGTEVDPAWYEVP